MSLSLFVKLMLTKFIKLKITTDFFFFWLGSWYSNRKIVDDVRDRSDDHLKNESDFNSAKLDKPS